MSVLLEVCVDSAQGLAAAIEGGADRIELCGALALGGLTPSTGLMALAAEAPVPVYAMIRPQEGDFVFNRADRHVMVKDIREARRNGLAGVVLGANRPDGRLDLPLLSELVEEAEGLGRTLHRAFDLTPDPFEALEQAIALGFERILTSGQELSAVDGASTLKELVRRADGRISIMAGSGVRPSNVLELVAATGVGEVHASCRVGAASREARAVDLGFAGSTQMVTSVEVVRQMRVVLDGRQG